MNGIVSPPLLNLRYLLIKMKFYITSVFVISIASMLALTLGCEDEVWQNSASSYKNCVANIKYQLETYHNKPDMESHQYTPTICM